MARDAVREGSNRSWTSTEAYLLAVICLLVGLGVGYFFRGSGPASTTAAASSSSASSPAQQQVTPEQLARMAKTQAEPLIAKLATTPNDPALLAKIGDIYYDTHQFKDAIDYYRKSLKIQPTNVDVRADMATCFWYVGDADTAIAEYEKALRYKPDHPGSLFNLGVVKWQGKLDASGAVKTWETLLRLNPNYKDKARVEDLIARARQHTTVDMTKAPKS